MRCIKCGSEINNNDKFCYKCGENLELTKKSHKVNKINSILNILILIANILALYIIYDFKDTIGISAFIVSILSIFISFIWLIIYFKTKKNYIYCNYLLIIFELFRAINLFLLPLLHPSENGGLAFEWIFLFIPIAIVHFVFSILLFINNRKI